MKLEPLYKMTKTGKTQFWQIEILGNKYRTISGQTDGKKVTSEWTITTGKNIGKSNGTSDEEQAIVEARARWTKKSETGYYVDVNNIGIKQYFEPMLAKDFDDYKDNLEFPLFSQPKLDGCLSYDTLVSTNIGDIKIGEIVEYNIECNVKTFNEVTSKTEYKKILNRMKNGVDIHDDTTQWYRVEMEDGRYINITGNHLIYIPALKCWRRVDELRVGDKLLNIF